jgi:cytochrome c oxidase cbb3-type subunit I/II
LLTLRGVWDKVRTDAVLKFYVVAITGYGMATFEGPMLSLKNVNAIAHFTDWIVAHVHVGALAWNGFMAFGMIYWLLPRMTKSKLYSDKLANFHFWIGTLGIILYALPMYVAGFTQASMWNQFKPGTGSLEYGNFLETVTQIVPMYWMRAIGGTLYLVGVIVMVYNVIKTVRQGAAIEDDAAEAPALSAISPKRLKGEKWHSWLERKPVQFSIYTTIAIVIGGAVQILPTIFVESNIPTISAVKPYTPLELQGRDIYIREGCVGCHSQMIRPFRSEVERYGDYSKSGEFVYDHPFLWGSKRTGPDLAREGVSGKPFNGGRDDVWHFNHFYDPQSISPGSIMPRYQWLIKNELDNSTLQDKMEAMVTLGVPYSNEEITNALQIADKQATEIETRLLSNTEIKKAFGGETAVPLKNREVIALIAYMQRLGTDTQVKAKK